MLKKKDLVKEFELVVKQEIIEHNNSILANNLAMQMLRDNVATLEKEIKENFTRLKSEIIDNKNSILELFNLVERCSKKSVDESHANKLKLAKNVEDLKKDILTLSNEFVSQGSFSS